MAEFCIIENNIITNIILAESLDIAKEVTQKNCIPYADGACIGGGWDGNSFTPLIVSE